MLENRWKRNILFCSPCILSHSSYIIFLHITPFTKTAEIIHFRSCHRFTTIWTFPDSLMMCFKYCLIHWILGNFLSKKKFHVFLFFIACFSHFSLFVFLLLLLLKSKVFITVHALKTVTFDFWLYKFSTTYRAIIFFFHIKLFPYEVLYSWMNQYIILLVWPAFVLIWIIVFKTQLFI